MKIKSIFFTVLLTLIGWSKMNAQVTHVNSQSNQVAGASLTITRPVGLQAGDLMIINLNIREGGAVPTTIPAGWTQTASYAHASPNRWVWIGYKVAVAADVSAAAFTFGRTSATDLAGAISAFRNVLTTTNGGIDVVGTAYVANNANPIAPTSITTLDNNNLVLFLGQVQSVAFNGADGWRLGGAAGTLMTELYAVNPGTSICGVGAAIFTRPTAGASGVGYKQTADGRKAGILLSIKSVQCTVNASVSKVDAVCGGSNGSITVSGATGGSGNYQYRLGTGTWQTSASFTGLAAGTYSVQIRDTNDTSCAVTLGNQTIASGALQATVARTNQGCAANGTITVSSPIGGSNSYQYRLDAGIWQSSGSFTGLSAGTYSVQMRDANNITCEVTLGNKVLTFVPDLLATVTRTNQSCASNGSITLSNPTGGSGSYQYRLDSGAWQAGSTFTNLLAGTYSVQMRDANNITCVVTLGNQTIALNSAVSATVSRTNQVCGTLGTVTFSNPTGASTFEYRLNSGAWQSSPSFTNVIAGTYTPAIRDAVNITCTATLATVTITGLTGLDSDGDSVPNDCDQDDDNDGILDVNECGVGVQNLTDASVQAIPNSGETTSTLISTGGGTAVFQSTRLHFDNYLSAGQGDNFPNNSIVFYDDEASGTLPEAAWNWTSTSVTFTFPVAVDRFQIKGYDFDGPGNESISALSSTPTSTSSNVAVSSGFYRSTSDNQTVVLNFALSTPITQITFNCNRPSAGFVFAFTVAFDGCLADADGDRVPDYLDTDSDSDGCVDAIEGGGPFTATNVDGNNRLTGEINGNGIPTVAGSGQTVGGSTIAAQLAVTAAPTNQVSAAPAGATFTIATIASNSTGFTGPISARVPVYGSAGNGNTQTLYQWYLGNPDAGGMALTNNLPYSGVTTASLAISNTTGLGGNEYYVVVSHSNNSCIREVRSARLFCVKPGITTGGTQESSNVGISVMQQNAAGFQNRNNGHLILEAKTKGFVITRLTTANLPSGAAAVKGMLVYDTTVNCLKMYNGTTWGCLTPACPD